MIIEARVISKEITTYESKYGRKTQTLLCCIDLCLNAALKTSFDYVLSPFDEENYPGIEADRKITLGINRLAPGFGGRPRMQGKVLKFKSTYGNT